MSKKKVPNRLINLPGLFKIPLFISIFLLIGCLACIFVFGLRLDIDFVGGSILELESSRSELSKESLNESVGEILPENTIIKTFDDDKKANLEMSNISDAKHSEIIDKIQLDSTYVKELSRKNEDKMSLEVMVENEQKFDKNLLQSSLRGVSLFGYDVNLEEEDTKAIISGDKVDDEAKIDELVREIQVDNSYVKELSFRNVGSIIGEETKQKAVLSVSLALVGIILYLAWSFQKVSKANIGFRSWHYGLAAIITLVHDLIIVLGIFSILSYYLDITVGTYFLIALLTILGYSVNDTIVIFDRLRDNLLHGKEDDLGKSMVLSVRQSAKRSINTSLTTLIVLGFLYFIGGEESEVIKYFSLALFIGILVGTYSSIFIANSILFFLHRDV
jgi:preprotein translocase subunit SecF